MKIAMIGQKCVPAASGGVERHVEELSRRLVERGHMVTVYNRRGYLKNKTGTYSGIHLKEIFTVRNKNLEALLYAFLASVKAILDRQELVHYHALGPAAMCFIPRIFGKKVVTTIHGLDWQRAKWGKLARAYLKLGEAVSVCFSHRIIVVSGKLKKYMDAKYPDSAEKIVYIPNGVPPAEILPAIEITEKYGLDSKGYILFLARLVPEKGCHYLLKAFCEINRDIKLVIAGGSSYSDQYCRELMKYSSDKIIFTGDVHGNLLKELYSNALFYVLPSEIEGLPISLLEAMSYGLCPLVSDIEENMEVISSETDCGYHFQSANVEDLRVMLETMLSNVEKVFDKGLLAKRLVEERFRWDTAVDRTDELYKLV